MKRYLLPLLLFFLSPPIIFGEELLKVRPKETPKAKPSQPITQGDIREYEAFRSSLLQVTALQFHIITPLMQEIFPEKRFRAWGNYFSVSFPLFQLSEKGFVHFEPGVGITLIRLSLSQPAVDFSHLFILFPVRARLLYEFNSKFFGEAFVGVALRPWENDSREPPDGGFHKPLDNVLTFDAGLGGGVFLNDNLFGRLSFGVQWLALGFGILL